MPKTKINNINIHYEIYGEGEPVAFLNGVLMTIQSWTPQLVLFKKRYQCIMHDFRGQLLSDKPDEPYSMEQHADDFLKLLDHLKIEKCHIIGTSYGGDVGLVFAYKYPHRVNSLAVIASVSYVEPLLREQVESWAELAQSNPDNLYKVLAAHSYSNRFLKANPNLINEGRKRFKLLSKEFFDGFSRLVDAFKVLDITDQLHKITCPTLLIASDKDMLKPPHYSQIMHEVIPNSEFVIIPGAGHASVIESTDVVNTVLLGFLEKNS